MPQRGLSGLLNDSLKASNKRQFRSICTYPVDANSGLKNRQNAVVFVTAISEVSLNTIKPEVPIAALMTDSLICATLRGHSVGDMIRDASLRFFMQFSERSISFGGVWGGHVLNFPSVKT